MCVGGQLYPRAWKMKFKKAVDEFKNCNGKIELWKCARRLNGLIAEAAKFDTRICASDVEIIVDRCKMYERCGDVALLQELRVLIETILQAIYADLIHADRAIHLQRVMYKAHLIGEEISKSICRLRFDLPENSAALHLPNACGETSDLVGTP